MQLIARRVDLPPSGLVGYEPDAPDGTRGVDVRETHPRLRPSDRSQLQLIFAGDHVVAFILLKCFSRKDVVHGAEITCDDRVVDLHD